MWMCVYVRHHFKDDHYLCLQASQTPITIHILKTYDERYSKITRGHKYKYNDIGFLSWRAFFLHLNHSFMLINCFWRSYNDVRMMMRSFKHIWAQKCLQFAQSVGICLGYLTGDFIFQVGGYRCISASCGSVLLSVMIQATKLVFCVLRCAIWWKEVSSKRIFIFIFLFSKNSYYWWSNRITFCTGQYLQHPWQCIWLQWSTQF